MNATQQPRHHVLLIEPHSDLREILREMLDREGYETTAAPTVEAGIAAAERKDVSAVVADLRGHAGAQFAAAFRRLKTAVGPANIGLMTGSRPDQSEVLAFGFAFLLLKPFAIEEFLASVGRQVGGSPSAACERAVHEYFEALSRRDWAALGQLCTREVQYHLPGTDPRFSRIVEGRDAFCAFAEATFRDFPEATFSVQEQVALPTAVVGRFRSTWKAGPRTTPELAGSVLFRFEGDLISQVGVRMELQRLIAAMDASTEQGG